MKRLYSTRNFFLTTTLLLATVLITRCSKGGSGSNPAPALSITSLSANSGPFTTAVSITGTGFSTVTTNDKVFFNGVAATVTQATETKITTSVPLAAGTGDVTLTVNGNTATGPLFTYQQTEVVTTFAGGGAGSSNSVDGQGTAAKFFQPQFLTTDAAGNIYVADTDDNLIRKITPGGLVSTLAGGNRSGSVDGTGTSAGFSHPLGIAVDGSGNIYVADNAALVRKIDPTGVVTTLTGNGKPDNNGGTVSFANLIGLAADAAGNVFAADQGVGKIYKITPTGVVTRFYGGGNLDYSPYGITVDKNGNIYTADANNNSITKITASGVGTVFAGGNFLPVEADGTGTSASFINPWGITADADGNLFVTDNARLIRKITPGAVVTTFAGENYTAKYDGPVTSAFFLALNGIAVDKNENIYVIDTDYIRKISFQ